MSGTSERTEQKRSKHRWYEYKVEATIEFEAKENSRGDTTLDEMESRWLDYKERAVKLADELRESGYGVEIRTRQRESYAAKDFDLIPERSGGR